MMCDALVVSTFAALHLEGGLMNIYDVRHLTKPTKSIYSYQGIGHNGVKVLISRIRAVM